MRIPPEASVGVRSALQEIDQRLQAIEARVRAPEVTASSLQLALDALREEVRRALIEPGFRSWDEIFGGPRAVSRAGMELLALDGKQIVVTDDVGSSSLPGLVPFKVGADDPVNKFNILGNLFVAGSLSVSDLLVGGKLTHHMPCAYLSRSNVQTITSGAVAAISYDTRLWDFGSMWDPANPTRLTAQDQGIYLFGFHAGWQNAGGVATRRQFNIYKNGNNAVRLGTLEWAPITSVTIASLAALDFCKAGDFYESGVFQDSGGNLDIRSDAGTPSPRFWAVQLMRT